MQGMAKIPGAIPTRGAADVNDHEREPVACMVDVNDHEREPVWMLMTMNVNPLHGGRIRFVLLCKRKH